MIFSVVIPSHKRKALLADLLKSLESQSLEKDLFEVIVVATKGDEAFDLANKDWNLNIEFTYVPNDPSEGRSASAKRNHGGKNAQAPWIAFVDDDCIADRNWLKEAHKKIESESPHFMEGQVVIPPPERETFTYKGIKRLSRPGGFQTCNMFYRKADFLEAGGFDPNFPYYLEDTDLGWTFKEANKSYVFLDNAKVSHPVPPAAPKKMLESAFRMEKLPYLFKKHQKTFKESSMRALPRPYFILSLIDISILLFLPLNLKIASALIFLKLTLTFGVLFRMLRGCHWSWGEALSMFYYLLICPIISLIWLIRGNLKHNVWIFLK